MNRFEYDITKHSAEEFSKTCIFCTATGQCNLEEVPDQENDLLKQVLNERGSKGWELVQFSFGKDGLIAFWKRRLEAPS